MEFVERIAGLGLPIVWIDHHDVKHYEFNSITPDFFKYNSYDEKKKHGEPVTAKNQEVNTIKT